MESFAVIEVNLNSLLPLSKDSVQRVGTALCSRASKFVNRSRMGPGHDDIRRPRCLEAVRR